MSYFTICSCGLFNERPQPPPACSTRSLQTLILDDQVDAEVLAVSAPEERPVTAGNLCPPHSLLVEAVDASIESAGGSSFEPSFLGAGEQPHREQATAQLSGRVLRFVNSIQALANAVSKWSAESSTSVPGRSNEPAT